MEKTEIIKQLFDNHFIKDPSKRSLVPFAVDSAISSVCVYTDKSGNNCAVGMCLTTEALKDVLEAGNNQIEVAKLFRLYGSEVLKEQYRGHSIEFWEDLQKLHDNESFWSKTGLSKSGKIQHKKLLIKYK